MGVMSMTVKKHEETGHFSFYYVPWEPTTFILGVMNHILKA